MMNSTSKPTVIGTRSGYVIRFTCSSCYKENSIIQNSPKPLYQLSRDVTCEKCGKKYTVLCAGRHEKMK